MKKISLSVILSSMFSASFATCMDDLKPGVNYNLINLTTDQKVYQETKDKIQITEFFWYGCPHCYHMEPMIKDFVAKHPNVEFKRYPLTYPNWKTGAQYYFAEQQLGLFDKLHAKSFDAIHKDNLDILNNKDVRAKFLTSQGVDVPKFEAAFSSFTMNSQLTKAFNYAKAYKLTSAPSFVVNNTIVVDPSLGKNYEGVIKNLDIVVKSYENKSCKIK
jgi:thiol:disulfide interchange protein DsbA